MQWKRGRCQKKPQYFSLRSNTREVPNAWDTDIQPCPSRVRAVYLGPSWCDQSLHAVVASRQQDGTDDVNNDMNSSIEALNALATAVCYDSNIGWHSLTRMIYGPEDEGKIDDESDEGSGGKGEGASPPAALRNGSSRPGREAHGDQFRDFNEVAEDSRHG